MSLSARRAWIEIWLPAFLSGLWAVALRKESVDRNDTEVGIPNTNTSVALRKESVDRNNAMQIVVVKVHASLSARRAWIEIGVDFAEDWLNAGRSPQGERG